MITIYQIPLTNDQITRANTLGFEVVPEVHAKTRLRFGFNKFKEEYLKFFQATYKVDTYSLEEAFDATNLWGDYDVECLRDGGSSSSVGDIFVLDGNCYFCDNKGWVALGKYEGFK